MTSPDGVDRMIRQVWGMPYGSGQIAAAEEAIRQADALGDPDLSFDARMAATPAYQHGGEPAKAFVTFSWCLAEFDRNPGARDAEDGRLLRWYFKYVVWSLTRFPELPLHRTYAVLDDMQARFQTGGHSLHAVYQYRWAVAHHIGEVAAADEWYDRWYAAARDENSDCAGCDPTSKVTHLVERGREAEAVDMGGPVLAGRIGCREQPQSILTRLLVPYLRTGRLDEARDAHRRAYRQLRDNIANLGDVNDHLHFCGVTGNEARGLEIMERHLDWLDRAPTPHAAMYFAAASAQVLGRLAANGHGAMTVQRRPHGERPGGEVAVTELRDELAAMATGLAARFDARNGTSHQGDVVARWIGAEPLVEYLPLSPAAARLRPPPLRPPSGNGSTVDRTPAGRGGKARTAAIDDVVVTGPDELLDLIEEAYFAGDDQRGFALVALFNTRFGQTALSVPQQARHADFEAATAANERGDLAAAQQHWRVAMELYGEIGAVEQWHAARGRLGLTLCETGNLSEGLPMTEEAATFLLAKGSAHLRAAAAHRLAGALLIAGRPEDALVALDRAAAHAPESRNRYTAYAIELSRAQCMGALGRIGDAVEAARRAKEGFTELGHSQGVAASAWAMALGLEMTGDIDAAVAGFDDAIAYLDDPKARGDARHHRAHLLAGTDRAGEVVEDLIEVVAGAEERGDHGGAAQARFDLAVAYRNAGRLLDAAEIAEEAVPALAEANRPDLADRCRYLLAMIYRDLGDTDSALGQFDQLTANLDGFDNAAARAQMHEEAAEILYRLDRDAEAAKRFRAAAETFHTAGLALDEIRTRRMAALSLRWAGELEAAQARLDEADAAASKLPEGEPSTQWERAMLGYDGARVLLGAEQLDQAVERIAGVAAMFRSIDAYAEALQAEVFESELWLRQGRPTDAEGRLRAVLSATPAGSEVGRNAAWLLSEALEALGRPDEARALREQYGLEA